MTHTCEKHQAGISTTCYNRCGRRCRECREAKRVSRTPSDTPRPKSARSCRHGDCRTRARKRGYCLTHYEPPEPEIRARDNAPDQTCPACGLEHPGRVCDVPSLLDGGESC